MKKSKIFLNALLATSSIGLVTAPILTLASCGNNEKDQIPKKANELSLNTLVHFFNDICKFPHPTYWFGPLNKHLTNFIEEKFGVTVYRDDYLKSTAQEQWDAQYKDYYGNIWFDIPASSGYENYPKVILQGHVDMVIDGISVEEAKTTPIKPELDFDEDTGAPIMHSEGHKTSLGADDGIGLSIILSLIEDKTINHGPIRVLFTADEEDGLIGAANLGIKEGSEKKYDVLGDCKYLLNIDNETLGDITKSSGGIRYIWYQFNDSDAEGNAKPVAIDSTLTNQFTISASGFKGGHSGGEIIDHANAIKAVLDVLNAFNNTEENKFQLISASTSANVVNTIPRDAVFTFATNVSKEKINNQIKTVLDNYKTNYPAENYNAVKVECEEVIEPVSQALGLDISKKLITMMSSFLYGVKEYLVPDKIPSISANIGPINLAIDEETNLYTFKFGTASRSCYRNILEDFESQNVKLSNDFLGPNHYDVFGKAPPFEPEEVNSLRSILADGFTKYGITPQIADTAGGLEISYFKEINPSIIQTSVGATILNSHTIHETMYLDTLVPTIEALLYSLPLLK